MRPLGRCSDIPVRTVFVSSVQSEFKEERAAIRAYILGDRLLSSHFDVFIFEQAPAQDRSPKRVYLDEVDRCSVYIGLFGAEYGYEDKDGISPTEREFDRAVAKRKDRLIFIKEDTRESRAPKMAALVSKAEAQVVRRTFTAVQDLSGQIYSSLVHILERDGLISSRPFDARISTLKAKQIDGGIVDEFVTRASDAGKLRLKRGAKAADVLKHLNMLDTTGVSNAAVLLFTQSPAAVIPGARVACMHFPGAEAVRPALAQTVFEGSLFAQIDDTVEFVMSRIARAAGTREGGAQVQATFEIPQGAVAEAVVNALAHRDYSSNAPTQVFLFMDRIEIRNQGELPRSLTPDQLKRVHPSIPHNPLLVDGLYRAGYVDRAGTGTLDMLSKCRDAGLGEPQFFQDGDQWVVRLWRDWANEDTLKRLGLSARQIVGIVAARAERRITTMAYMAATGTTRATAKRDLDGLVGLGMLELVGSGRGAAYVFVRKWLKNGSKA